MNNAVLLPPLILIVVAATLAALYGLPTLNRRLGLTKASWLLAIAPFVAFIWLIPLTLQVSGGTALVWQIEWIPSLGLPFGFYFDSLSALFALVVIGIGTLVIIYTGYYFKGNRGAWRFLTYMFLFMFAMLGMVMAGDVITLFIFWEGTSFISFLLIAYNYKDAAARKGAFKALIITGGGGIALLAGLLFVSSIAGSTVLPDILSSGDLLRGSTLYPIVLLLVAFGAFTKSAQFPAHIWLPAAMTAPTPASTYLHSATMVKAGIYLMARFYPALGGTDLWFWLLTVTGMLTMLSGAYLGLKQNDMKALLAYSTISQLGIMILLIGQNTAIAFKALVIGIVAHALYKSALFMVAGIVDHETGTRDLRRLGGLWRPMKITFTVATVAALSAAGFPPLLGFLAKETLLATAIEAAIPESLSLLFPTAVVITGALLLAQMALLIWETFLGKPKDPSIHGHEASWGLILAPAIPALMSVLIVVEIGAIPTVELLAHAASAAFGDKVKVSLHLWSGINLPLILSAVAITIGVLLFLGRHRIRAWQNLIPERWSFDTVYAYTLRGLSWVGTRFTWFQQGKLRYYMMVVLCGVVVLTLVFTRSTLSDIVTGLDLPSLDVIGGLNMLRLFSLIFAVATALATVFLRRGFYAILALSVSGLAVALLMLLEPSPDVALVQIVVDILSLVILVLALIRLPRPQRLRAWRTTFRQAGRVSFTAELLIAVGSGLIVTLLTLHALVTRNRLSEVTPFYEVNAKKLTGASDIVGAIVIDFRASDTLIEIAVFGMAGLGMYTLLRFASQRAGDYLPDSFPVVGRWMRSMGISGSPTSSFVRAISTILLPVTMVIAATHIMYGHDLPGDGFTAGVIVSLVVGLWYVIFGYDETRARLPWLRPRLLISSGLLLAVLQGTAGAVLGGAPFAPVDFGELLGLPLPAGFHISTALLFEIAVFLSVLGSASLMLNTLGHPGYADVEVVRVNEIVEARK